MKPGKPLERKTALKPGTKTLKRGGQLKPMSAKAKKRIPARRAAMKIVRERDGYCQFWLRLIVWAQESGAVYFPNRPGVDGAYLLRQAKAKFNALGYPTPDCFGDLCGHEPLKRSHGADITDPDQIILLCAGHNSWVEDQPDARKLLGL